MNKISNVPKYEIKRVPFEQPMEDVMGGDGRWEIPVHNHGLVALCDVFPRFVPVGRRADFRVVQAARTSYGGGLRTPEEDTGLLNYLSRHRHTTPSEMVVFLFHMKLPIFVARQWVRHRMASLNEISGRYSVMKDEFYRPETNQILLQSKGNKQGGEEVASAMTAQAFLDYLDEIERKSYEGYMDLIGQGISKEQARIALPLNLYTQWYWKADLHNLFHLLGLRMDSHAQKEIRDYANAVYRLIEPIVPDSCETFVNYKFEALTLSRDELIAFRTGVFPSQNKRAKEEWEEKKEALGLP